MNSIVIVDYGLGNLYSIYKSLNRLNVKSDISSDISVISKACKLILPGVGHFKRGMQNLTEMSLIETLRQKITVDKTPILGICLGAQLMAKHSEEGNCKGLGFIDANVVKFNICDKKRYKVPHMGWNNAIVNKNVLNYSNLNNEEFYFVHSYHLVCRDTSDIWMTTEYEYKFTSAVNKENIYGVQFHPEKSHDAGLNLLSAFLKL
ncbi:MAG TPA: imidazole glycerol phosphate synthase subunit HisH [Ignavibacteriaceae bacterium]|nr:imidazole glycerol phosphate synthase subunit HisH [Ignavibacteriaceae bacterium]